jgi:hypothetical protein
VKIEGATGEAERLVQVEDLWPTYPERPTQTQAGGGESSRDCPLLAVAGPVFACNESASQRVSESANWGGVFYFILINWCRNCRVPTAVLLWAQRSGELSGEA